MIKRGALIVLERCDRSGKPTQCQKVKHLWLQESNKEAHLMRFPDEIVCDQPAISSYICYAKPKDGTATELFTSARLLSIRPDIKKLLQKGTNVIVDRYSYSGIAFSAAKPNMDLRWCQQSDSGLLKPDLVIFLDIDPVEAETRGQYGSERYENLEMQKVVRSNYLKLQDESWRVMPLFRRYEFSESLQSLFWGLL
ncbi:hypothetical protein DAPPUDRAFT_63855 [Daphnia pulex]|uniref:dTMP kinase n=1 Tax=Daphnia pulex TaxID=6669 RepID=E9HL37_DAPPU|nr:hypothetical protein DAPPUDRAFT_63855 [Daphnia pulex]|eukprot:EFX67536.1 hypothetical protein DAPPUDRAFT_63855 [Daphnia pulex]